MKLKAWSNDMGLEQKLHLMPKNGLKRFRDGTGSSKNFLFKQHDTVLRDADWIFYF